MKVQTLHLILVAYVIQYIFLHFSLPYSHPMVVYLSLIWYYFLSHLQRFIVDGFFYFFIIFIFMDPNCDLSCMLSLTHLVYLVAFQVQFTQSYAQSRSLSSLSCILGLVHLAHAQSSSVSLLSCILGSTYLDAFQVQLTQMHFGLVPLDALQSSSLGFTHEGIFRKEEIYIFFRKTRLHTA